ncbi:aspartate--tRNA ligase [candidate division WOR-3 bacterium]|nr:aspartate--tRNA ligase [candidate division WOR-3 bacterium]
MTKFATSYRTSLCGEIRGSMTGNNVRLCGWINSLRKHGGITFIDLRDRSGIVQIVVHPENITETSFRLESAISIEGSVRKRPEDMVNRDISTGEIEIEAASVSLVSDTIPLPFLPEEEVKASTELRLKHRYLDLRRNVMFRNLWTRHLTVQAIRDFLAKNGFIEIETPYMTAPTPEGARDYLVPSRIHPGKFYALAQSPQLYKQLLMVSGVDRYFQFARCFRDEDMRADRQPEHTQIDIEMSFVSQEDVLATAENLFSHIFKTVLGKDIPVPFTRLTYEEAQSRFGSDKPDNRFGTELFEITDAVRDCGMRILDGSPFTVSLFAENFLPSRKEIEELEKTAKDNSAGGLLWVKFEGSSESGPMSKYLNPRLRSAINPDNKNGCALIVAGEKDRSRKALGAVRLDVGKRTGAIKDSFNFLWVTDFPLFEKDENGVWTPCHHIFTMPNPEDINLLEEDPGKVRGLQYDLVLNGVELASGSIRNHNPRLQEKCFSILGFTPEQIEKRFGFLIHAFEYAPPPHGGIAPGIDRLVMMMTGSKSISDVIAFPKTLQATGLMEDCPREIEQEQLKELGLKKEQQ